MKVKELLASLFVIVAINAGHAQTSDVAGWHLTGYSFKDGSLKKESVLAGTSAKMTDVVTYKGDKGNIEITQNRTDVSTGKLLAGVTYRVIWSDTPAVLLPNEKTALQYQLSTISSTVWKAPQQTVSINQGASGLFFASPNGTKYIKDDMSATLTSGRAIERGTKGNKRTIQVSLGNGFIASYNYEWRD